MLLISFNRPFAYYLSTFQKKRSGRRIGYVHYTDTIEGSLKIPFSKGIVKRYMCFFYMTMAEHLVVVKSNLSKVVQQNKFHSWKGILSNINKRKMASIAISQKFLNCVQEIWISEQFA